MGKEQRQPTAAELILVAQKKKTEEWRIQTEIEPKNKREAGEEVKQRGIEMKERNKIFQLIDGSHQLSELLRGINSEVLGGRGDVIIRFPYTNEEMEGKEKDYKGNDRVVYVKDIKDDMMEITLRWDYFCYMGRGSVNEIYVLVKHDKVGIFAGGETEYINDSEDWRREFRKINGHKYNNLIYLSDPDFKRQYSESLAAAFEKSHQEKIFGPTEWWLNRRFA